jgi:phosphotransferase system HPr-like phosphotransfer protein
MCSAKNQDSVQKTIEKVVVVCQKNKGIHQRPSATISVTDFN